MWTLHRLGCGMPFDAARPKNSTGKLSVPSKEATRHMISNGFQNGISHFEKKIKPSSPISFYSFGNLKKVCKKLFFHVDAIALAAYAKQLLPHGKAAVCCILPRGIVWTHLYSSPPTSSGRKRQAQPKLRSIPKGPKCLVFYWMKIHTPVYKPTPANLHSYINSLSKKFLDSINLKICTNTVTWFT